jgi:hypothetical protein
VVDLLSQPIRDVNRVACPKNLGVTPVKGKQCCNPTVGSLWDPQHHRSGLQWPPVVMEAASTAFSRHASRAHEALQDVVHILAATQPHLSFHRSPRAVQRQLLPADGVYKHLKFLCGVAHLATILISYATASISHILQHLS